MANDTTSDILYFDTTAGASVTRQMRIRAILWTANEATNRDIAADDDFEVQNASGNPIVGKRAATAGDDFKIEFGEKGFPVNGVSVTKLDGGVCYIHVVT